MKGFLKFIRIAGIVLLCVLVLLSVCALPSFIEFPRGDGSTEPPIDSGSPPTGSSPPLETDPSPKEYITVDGEALGIVDVSKVKYGYSEMVDDLEKLSKKYGDKMSYAAVGDSLDGRKIYAVTLGNPNADKQIVISAGIHAREYLTPLLVMKQLEFYLYNYDTAEYNGIPLSRIFDEYQFCILPMCNPDGVTLSQFGLGAIRSDELKDTIRSIYESDKQRGYTNDSLDKYLHYWKANARGVDLNRNFDTADWNDVLYVNQPSFRNYKGISPLSEPETKAMTDYIESLPNPVLSLAIHSQGEVIYFDCGQDDIHPSLELARTVNSLCGYRVIYETRRDAAFDDWCTINKGIPSVTVETGDYSVTDPILLSEFEEIWEKVRDLWVHVAVEYMD